MTVPQGSRILAGYFLMFAILFSGLQSAQSADVPAPASASPWRSPLALATDPGGARLFVAEYEGCRITVVDAAAGVVRKMFALPGAPTGLALAGNVLYVTCGGATGRLCALDAESGQMLWENQVGHTPISPVVAVDGKTVYVPIRFNNVISVIDTADHKERQRISVAREPFAAALAPDGKTLWVAHLLPAGRADAGNVAASVTAIDTVSGKTATVINLPNGSTSAHGICLSPDGAYVYVTHILARYQVPASQLAQGWMNTAALTVIDAATRKIVNTVMLDDLNHGAADPWGVCCSADGAQLVVAHSGVREMSIIDRRALHQRMEKAADGKKVTSATSSAADVPNDMTFLLGIRRRIVLPGDGPRPVAITGKTAWAGLYFGDSLAAVDLASGAARKVSLGPVAPPTPERAGEILFHDAQHCYQQWQSCASCHPDARVDGLNWDLLNDGIGNPKNTRNMLNAFHREPVMSLGVRDSAGSAVRAGIRYILLAVRPEEEAKAIDAFIKSIRPEPSPYLVNGSLSPSAVRGRELFSRALCASCHSGPLFTDLNKYDLETTLGADTGKPLITPTLIEVWRTAPYLHDGRYSTMRELLTAPQLQKRHGNTSALTPKEIDDLVEYVLSL